MPSAARLFIYHNKRITHWNDKTGFKLTEKIETLDEFWKVVNEDKSIFARHRMYPSAFFMSWQIKLINEWLNRGWFFRAIKI